MSDVISSLNTEFYRAKRYERPLSVILFHLNGDNEQKLDDKTIELVVQSCLSLLRQSDSFGLIEEGVFAVVLPETLIYDAEELADRMHEMVAVIQVQNQDKNTRIVAGFGVSTFSPFDDSADDLLSRARSALNDAKNYDNNTVRTRHIEPAGKDKQLH